MNNVGFYSYFRKKEVIIGFFVVAILISGLVYFLNFKKQNQPTSTPAALPAVEFKKEFENSFKYNIPEDASYVELKSVSGRNERGLATKNEILIDVEEPESGYFYQAWLEKDNNFVSLGKFRAVKGGFLLNYDADKYPDYKKVVVSLEKNFDNKIETKILEASF